jgi:hypothetical protein
MGADPVPLLALADVRWVVTPFPSSIPGSRLVRRVDGVGRYELAPGVGRVFFAKDVKQATDAQVLESVRRKGFDPDAVAYTAEDPGRLPPAEGKSWSVARFVKDEPEEAEISVTSSRPSFLVLTRSWDPGWTARVDDLPARVLRTDLAFMGVVVPAGDHRIVLRYRPRAFVLGAWLSGISLFIGIALFLAGSPPRRP